MVESNQQKWERYIQNLRRVRTLSHPQFPPETAPEFLLEAIQGNAVRCFDLMKENNALLGELVCTRDAKTLSDSDIAELEEAAGRLFNYANSEDCGVAYKIHELLLKAARFRDDVPMIVRELYYNGITLHYINVRDEDHDVNLLWPRIHAFFLEGADYIARYEELDKETRQYIIRCVGKLDPDIPWARFTYSMHMDQMTLMAYLRHCNDPEVAERVLRSASYVYKHQKKNAGEESRQQNWRVSYFYHAALYHAGKGTARAVVEDLLEMIDQTGEQDYSPDGINRNLTGSAYLFYYEAFLSEQDRAELADRIAKERAAVHRYLVEMPGNEYPRVASMAIRELITAQSDTKEIDNRKILESILSGHKPTYVHSTMVAHLTRVLLRRMIETDPAALIGLLGCKTAAEVQARKPELLQTAYECGLYHDVGKSAVIMYIDTNSRSLLEEEFCCIQSHPVIGCSLLRDAGYEEYLAPAALYHHCFYNGQGGYPRDVPPCPQDIKGIVDVLTVADALDAATDDIGRCYNRARPLRTLVGELQAQSGTRYAPDVVALFRDKTFCEVLAQKLDAERKKVYLQAYHAAE